MIKSIITMSYNNTIHQHIYAFTQLRSKHRHNLRSTPPMDRPHRRITTFVAARMQRLTHGTRHYPLLRIVGFITTNAQRAVRCIISAHCLNYFLSYLY